MVSIIIPSFNEEKSLLEFNSRLLLAVKTIKQPCEIIYIDDGSKDNSYAILLSIAKKDHRIKIIKFKKNYRQTLALKAGLDYSKGEIACLFHKQK